MRITLRDGKTYDLVDINNRSETTLHMLRNVKVLTNCDSCLNTGRHFIKRKLPPLVSAVFGGEAEALTLTNFPCDCCFGLGGHYHFFSN